MIRLLNLLNLLIRINKISLIIKMISMKTKYILGLLLLGAVVMIAIGVRANSLNKSAFQTFETSTSTQPLICIDEPEGKPVITSLSIVSGAVGSKLEIKGCNFTGFEGDKIAWIQNSNGVVGLLRGEEGSTSKLLKVTLKSSLCQKDISYSDETCDSFLTLIPGKYNIFVSPWGKESNKIEFIVNPSAIKSTIISYYIFDKKNTNETFCNGEDMDSAGFKSALTKKVNVTVSGNLTINERIIKTLSLASTANNFNKAYTRINEIVYKNNIVAMGSTDGWAGSSIFYCGWKPFVEKNLEQFSDVKKIIWDAFPIEVSTKTVKVFFNNIKFDPGLMDCSKVYSVERSIKSTPAVARAALEELLKGVTVSESDLGYVSNLNSGIEIQKLTIENGVAKVDFSAKLEDQVGGSCRTAAIIAQIKSTLKQFSTVQTVVISIDGRTEDILQP